MDARQRWQALQARLTAARAAAVAGDRTTALCEINAALDIDKDFLAAHALRDQILATPERTPKSAAAPPARATVTPAPTPVNGSFSPRAAIPTAVQPAAAAPSIVPAVYAQFEQRAKRRRVDRRIDAARTALEQRRLKAAAAALDEVIELDPNLPELAELTARFDELRRGAATTHRGPAIAAAVVFLAALLAGTWLQESSLILSRQMVSAAPLPDPRAPALPLVEPLAVPGAAAERETLAETPSRRDAAPAIETQPPVLPAAVTSRPAPAPIPVMPVVVPSAASSPGFVHAAPPVEMPPARVSEVARAAIEPAAVPPPPSLPAVSPAVAMPDDGSLIKQTLQRYRTAYEGLDARSAQAVWPAVNQAALARAFDGLESQSLTFTACDLRLRGEVATATCQGSARYVTKIGNREPHVEPRVWNFTLHKVAGDWTIESARAQR
jgi:hypothetical protein